MRLAEREWNAVSCRECVKERVRERVRHLLIVKIPEQGEPEAT